MQVHTRAGTAEEKAPSEFETKEVDTYVHPKNVELPVAEGRYG